MDFNKEIKLENVQWLVWKLPELKRERKGGRPAGLSKDALAKATSAKILYQSGEKTVKEIAQGLGISRATCYRYIELMK